MEEVIALLNSIHNLKETDPDAKERLHLYWQKLFLLEKAMTKEQRTKFIGMFDETLMEKRIYEIEIPQLVLPTDEITSLIDCAIHEVNKTLVRRNQIDKDGDNTYYQLCRLASILLCQTFNYMGYASSIVHTTDLGIDHVPHFFVVVNFNDKGAQKQYIVDMTFKQFLMVPFFIDERIYHYHEHFLSPAAFGEMNFFATLASCGYFLATDENLRIYFDGFRKASLTNELKDVQDLKRVRELKLDEADYQKAIKKASSDSNIIKYSCI